MIEHNWENFLQNLGEWRGSFTSVSLTGELLNSTPSILTLEGLENNQLVRFRLRRFEAGGYDEPPVSDYAQEYRTLGRQAIFFPTGAFSKGTLQLAPYSDFGAEYGFVAENRRLRFVQLYDPQGKLSSLTLIREFRSGTDAQERPPLRVDQLLGRWQGKACIAYADWQPSEICDTYSEIQDLGNDRWQLETRLCDRTLTATAQLTDNILHFEGPSPQQMLLLPDGTSSTTPLQISHRQAFAVELGWLVSPGERQRLIRSYNDQGEWVSATHIIEHRVAA